MTAGSIQWPGSTRGGNLVKSVRVRLFALTVPLTLVAMFALAPPASAAGVIASYADSTVSISGDAGGQDVRVARDLAGGIHVFQNDLEVPVSGGPATVANTDTVSVALQPADDLTIDMRQGTFTPGATDDPRDRRGRRDSDRRVGSGPERRWDG